MKEREITCIACPVGCRLSVWQDGDGAVMVDNNQCARGKKYGAQEYTAPMRMVTSSVRVIGGPEPLAAVRSAAPIPKQRIAQALREIHALSAAPPLKVGDILLDDLAQSGVALIVTRGTTA